MRNIRLVSKHFPKLEATYYAVFFDHKDIYGRLDWQLSDDTDGTVSPDVVADLMLQQLKADLNDEQTVEEIRQVNARDIAVKGSRLKQYLEEDGFIEHEAPEFKAKAVEMFGNE